MAKKENMHLSGDLFGLVFREGCSNGCVDVYVEDDGNYNLVMTIDRHWLTELAELALKGEVVGKLHNGPINNSGDWMQRKKKP